MIQWILKLFKKKSKVDEEIRNPEPIMVRTDLIDYKIDESIREKIREDFLNEHGNEQKSIDEVFNSLTLSSLSDEAKLKIIDIAYEDTLRRKQDFFNNMKGSD